MARTSTLRPRAPFWRRLASGLGLGALIALAPADASSQSATARRAAKTADQREVESFRLTKAMMDKWFAAQWGIVKLAQAHPELATESHAADEDESSGDQSLDRMAARIEKVPEIRRELQRAGITPREYTLTTLAIFQAAFAYAMKQQGLIKEIPAEVPAAHVALVAQYEQEMGRLQAEMKKLEKPPAEEPEDGEEPAASDSLVRRIQLRDPRFQ